MQVGTIADKEIKRRPRLFSAPACPSALCGRSQLVKNLDYTQ